MLAEILRAHPVVRGEVLDLAPSATAAADRFAADGLAGRAGAV
ncbi:methyltransferase, partial [Amycolatopsis mediterranei]